MIEQTILKLNPTLKGLTSTDSAICVACGKKQETIEHILLHCKSPRGFTDNLWKKLESNAIYIEKPKILGLR